MKSIYYTSDPKLKKDIGDYIIKGESDFKSITSFEIDTDLCYDLNFTEMVVYNFLLTFSYVPTQYEERYCFFRIDRKTFAKTLRSTENSITRALTGLREKGWLIVLKEHFKADAYVARY